MRRFAGAPLASADTGRGRIDEMPPGRHRVSASHEDEAAVEFALT